VEGNYSGTTEIIKPTAFTTTGLVNGETLTALSKFTVQYREVSRNDDNYVTELFSAGGTAVLSNYFLTQLTNKLAGDTQNMVKIKALADVVVDTPKWASQPTPSIDFASPQTIVSSPTSFVPSAAPVVTLAPAAAVVAPVAAVSAAPVEVAAAAPLAAAAAPAEATAAAPADKAADEKETSSSTTSVASATASPASSAATTAQGTQASTANVSVSVVTQPNAAGAGLVNVVVPPTVLRGGNSLVVSLPESVTQLPGNSNASANVTLTNNRPLPSWIKYDPAQRTLVVESTPSTSLPVTVTLTVGGQRTNIVVSESGNVGR
jgi:hypothetical protein